LTRDGTIVVRRPARPFDIAVAAMITILAMGPAHAGETAEQQRQAAMVMIGTIAFESPDLLGGSAAALGMSCSSCHPRGGTQTRLFIDTLSDKPGNVDVTNGVFSPLSEDNIMNPVNIPSLLGSRHTEPFGRRGNFETVSDFTVHAIVNEFIGHQPSELLLEALVAFQETLDFPAARYLSDDGRLDSSAPDPVRRGEAIFRRPGACATCHKPDDYFVDHLTHDVGTDGEFDTPSLRGSGTTAPYGHDGRFDTLAQAVDHFITWLELDLTADERADLLAYVETIGAVEIVLTLRSSSDEERALRRRFNDFGALMARLIALDDAPLTTLAVGEVNRSFKAIQMYYRDPPQRETRKVLGGWMEALRVVERHVAAGEPGAAREALAAYSSRVATDTLPLPLPIRETGGATRY
jgi:mono/diheme cytochrome c family protein